MSRLWRESVFFLFLSVFGFSGCDKDIQMVSLGIDDIYYLPRMKAYALHPAFTGEEYRWTLRSDGRDSLLSEKRDTFEIIDPTTPYKHDFRFVVMHEEIEYSPYISKVYEYRPAPGQFVNLMPEYQEGETEEDIRKKVEENISGTNDEMISLGSYGGYVIFGFDHTVIRLSRFRECVLF